MIFITFKNKHKQIKTTDIIVAVVVGVASHNQKYPKSSKN